MRCDLTLDDLPRSGNPDVKCRRNGILITLVEL